MRLFFPPHLFFVVAGLAKGQYSIQPDSVDIGTRDYWCSQQQTQCPLICLQLKGAKGEPKSNECHAEALTYTCVCSNGLEPNITQYSQTIPFFICQEWGNQCVAGCDQSDNTCANSCRADHPCGAQNPKRVKSKNPLAASTSSAFIPATGLGGSEPTNTDSPAIALTPMPLEGGQSFLFMLLGLFGGFAILL